MARPWPGRDRRARHEHRRRRHRSRRRARTRVPETALSNIWLLLTHWRVSGIRPLPAVTLQTTRGPRLAYAIPNRNRYGGDVMAQVIRWLRRWRRSEEGREAHRVCARASDAAPVVLGIAESGFVFQDTKSSRTRRAKALAWRCCLGMARHGGSRRHRTSAQLCRRRIRARDRHEPGDHRGRCHGSGHGGLPAIPVKRVTVTYTHTITFLSALDGLVRSDVTRPFR